MLEEMIAYQRHIQQILKENSSETDWKKEMKYFQIKLSQLQTERLIHLLVMLTVGIATLISCFITMTSQILPLFLLDGIFMVLFFAYILHYRKLENTTQSWYLLQKQLIEKQ